MKKKNTKKLITYSIYLTDVLKPLTTLVEAKNTYERLFKKNKKADISVASRPLIFLPEARSIYEANQDFFNQD